MKTPHNFLEHFPVIISLPLQWGDQDSLGHVNNIIYFRWAETARIDYLTRANAWDGAATAVAGPILAAIHCDFRFPLTYPDTIQVGASITALGNSSFKMTHRVVSAGRGIVAADLDSTLVWIDYGAGKAITLPATLRDAIEKLEGKCLPVLTRNRA
ncbi:putative thioesterase [Acidobacteriia bacterium SbA2]|nr:putative thioesterase [Acidobacteriia bacterium SbA2]